MEQRLLEGTYTNPADIHPFLQHLNEYLTAYVTGGSGSLALAIYWLYKNKIKSGSGVDTKPPSPVADLKSNQQQPDAKSPQVSRSANNSFQIFQFLTNKIELLHEAFEQDHTLMKDQLASALQGELKGSRTYSFDAHSQFRLYGPKTTLTNFEQFIIERAMVINIINDLATKNKLSTSSHPNRYSQEVIASSQKCLVAYQTELHTIQHALEAQMDHLLGKIQKRKNS